MLLSTNAAANDYQRDLGDGLVLRWSHAEDTEKIAQLVGKAFRRKEDEPENEFLMSMVQLLLSGRLELMGENDYGIVQDTSKDDQPIVAAICLERETFLYEGIPFALGRPEIVASDPAYRHRGLIRNIFEIIHARSEAEGHLVQGITGIPYFYRQFGYEYAIELEGIKKVALQMVPGLKDGEEERFTVREAIASDLPVISALYKHLCAQYMISVQLSDDFLGYLINGWQSDPTLYRFAATHVIVDEKQTIVGMMHISPKRWNNALQVLTLAIAPGVNQQELAPSLLRALATYGESMPVSRPDVEPFSEISFILGEQQSFYSALGRSLITGEEIPYAWYIRVSDLPRFIKHVAPALERRLANSPVAGYSGELKLSFYRDGLKLVFEKGRLTTAEPWKAPVYGDNSDGGFPPNIFLKALFGYRNLAELRHAYPDVWIKNESETLFNTLFPKKSSWTTPLP